MFSRAYYSRGSARSLVSSLALLVCAGATLAGCKGGGGGAADSAASASSVSTGSSTTTTSPTQTAASENAAPQITGATTSTVAANSMYSFKPAASDPNGDALVFQIQNKPVWATFNTLTGQLSGTPTLANAGTFSNIVISASDGVATTAMPAFSISVTKPSATNAATLKWSVPTKNTDGSALSDLAGFTIVYGTSEAALDQTVRIDNATASTYSLESFPSGTYYFAIKAFTAGGAESGMSSVVSKTFN
ncbi:MAG: hypothetical protein ABW106_09000 [Steroidobacteraceae bacterium]